MRISRVVLTVFAVNLIGVPGLDPIPSKAATPRIQDRTPALLTPPLMQARVAKTQKAPVESQMESKGPPISQRARVSSNVKKGFTPVDEVPLFDFPVTYNARVQKWVRFFQGPGRSGFNRWLERSHRYIPVITPTLERQGLPRDLVYLAMIESGYSPRAVSTASAVGYWQFIKPTATRYGLQVNWWIDERRDITKSTLAAANYLSDLYRMFGSWHLAASAYNMGEGRLKRLIARHKTRNYWVLSTKAGFPNETANYVPKIIAAMLIAKAPHLYGFNNVQPQSSLRYSTLSVPGGTDLETLASHLGVSARELRNLNPELLKGIIPSSVASHRIRVPHGQLARASQFFARN